MFHCSHINLNLSSPDILADMWGLFSKDPTKDFPYDSLEQVGQIHLANKSVWTLHKGKNRSSQEPVSIFSCDAKDGASATQLDVARSESSFTELCYYLINMLQSSS